MKKLINTEIFEKTEDTSTIGYKMISFNNKDSIKLIAKVDLLVIGGSIAGISAARNAAKNGKSVMLIEAEICLGYELTMYQRPWITYKNENEGLIKEWFPLESLINKIEGEVIPLHMDKLKVKLEDILLSEQVRILYACRPVDIIKELDLWTVVIGNKSGRQVIQCSTIIDATENSCTDWLVFKGSGLKKLKTNKKVLSTVFRTIEFTGLSSKMKPFYNVPNEFNIKDDKVALYPGAYSNDHYYVDFPFNVLINEDRTLEDDMNIEYEARKKSLEVSEYLINNEKDFADSKIGFGSYWVARKGDLDPVNEVIRGFKFAESIISSNAKNEIIKIFTNATYVKTINNTEKIITQIDFKEESTLRYYEDLPNIDISLGEIPLVTGTDLIVVGGGTSGATAAWVSGKEGLKTILTDMNSCLGGTGTIGGVSLYWFGRDVGFTKIIDNRVEEWSKRLKYQQGSIGWNKHDAWSKEIKAFVLLELCRQYGVEVLLGSVAIGTLVSNTEVVGTVIATQYGPVAITSKILVDATGDADIVAFAGVQTTYGNERDCMTFWTSLAMYEKPSETLGNFNNAADISNIFDYTRFILSARRKGAGLYDHGQYVAPRESRHIVGEVTLSLQDQFLMKKFKDTILLCFSNHDPKGISTSDILHFGLLPPNLEIEVPYGALLPKILDNILVIGKAISATHDAFAAIRMQRDLQQMGGVVALAVAYCIKNNITVKKLPVSVLQQRLIDEDMLPKEFLKRAIEAENIDLSKVVKSLTGEEKFEWLEMGLNEKAIQQSPIALICFSNPEIALPLLVEEFAHSNGDKKFLIARLLAWHGNDKGLDELVCKIKSCFDKCEQLPRRKGSVNFLQMLPDHGVMPEVIYLINVLAFMNNKKVIEVFTDLVDRILTSDRDYIDVRAGTYNYIASVVYAAEKLKYPEFIPIIEKLLELPELTACIKTQGFEVDTLEERLAYLSFTLARALAVCGCENGFNLLKQWTRENRFLISRSAHDELRKSTIVR